MKIAEGVPGVGEGMGESDGIVSPSLTKESGLGVAVGVGLVVGLVGAGVAVRLGGGVLDGEALVVASAGTVGVAVNSVTMGTAVGGVSTGEQLVKRMTARDRASQILAPNC